MKKLRHPNIILFMGAVASERRLCIVTEFLPRYAIYLPHSFYVVVTFYPLLGARQGLCGLFFYMNYDLGP
jgi:hypothetical protein